MPIAAASHLLVWGLRISHRITGGRCSGRAWVQDYHKRDGWACNCCASNLGIDCEVANGQERVHYCVGYRDHLRRGMNAPYPVDPACEVLLEFECVAEYSQHLQELEAAHTDDIPF